MKNLETKCKREDVTRRAFQDTGGAASPTFIAESLCEPEGLNISHHRELY